jgi:XTP/dITP diphosphohydrolase
MKSLVLASRNKNKIEELQQLLSPLGIALKSALDFPELQEVDEDQPTLEGNALKKARYVAEITGLPSLSDDTGLEVDALDGAPGVYSARYAGENATYADNVNKLLGALNQVRKEGRSARFRTVVALVDPFSGKEHCFEGKCEGQILSARQGEKGFGYDPIFLPNGYEQSFAEMTADIKNRISHRGRAIQAFVKFLGV